MSPSLCLPRRSLFRPMIGTCLGLSLLLPAAQVSANEQISGATIGYTCMGCHGVNGKSPGSIPSIAGQSAAQLASKLMAYREDKLTGTIMNRIAKGYTPAEIQAVAAFFAQQSTQ
ncbi:c-type cytochrome [Halothiobacillus sp. DCM-1]|uniref:c-type cytochrome n=1 Tax=Halothiobacillus sp. DCM-1 TaxID=3112558 RepID=UPI00325167EC